MVYVARENNFILLDWTNFRLRGLLPVLRETHFDAHPTQSTIMIKVCKGERANLNLNMQYNLV